MTNRKKFLVISIVIILAIAAVAVSLMLYYADTVKSTLDEEATSYLQEVTQQESTIIRTQVDGDLSTLESLAAVLSNKYIPSLDSDAVLHLLNDVSEQNGFKRMGLISTDGSAVTTDGHHYNFSERPYFEKALNGIPNVSDTFSDIVDGQSINVYAVPVYDGTSVKSVLFAANKTEIFEDNISVSTFNGNGYSYVVEKDGTSVARSNHKDSLAFDNIFSLRLDMVSDVSDNFATMNADMQQGLSGVTRYERDGVLHYMSYAPIGVNDWYVLSVVPSSVIAAKSTFLVTLTGWISGIIVATVVVLLIYIVISQSRTRKKLEQIAYVDELTGSLSWMKFREECKTILENNPDENFALINFDINKFKIFNQLYDYENGNQLIRYIAGVLNKDMHKNELYSHTGADDFDVLIEYTSEDDIVGRILKWNQQIRDYSFAQKRNYNLLLSYGIYSIAQGDTYITRMNDRSKIAKNSVKNNTHTFYAFYDRTMNQEMLREKELENDMDAALKNNEFEIYYQPKFDLETQKPTSAEALVRWKSPGKGFMSPGAFIPVFERNGFIIKLDMYVFEKVCAAIRKWTLEGHPTVPVSVNLSRLNMYSDDFVSHLKNIREKYDVSTDLIELELTESALAYNDELVVRRMNELKEAGFRIAIDDFGTGYSSLNLLRTLPVDVIKLDKRFFTQNLHNERERVIITSIVSMAQQLGITVVAEGVETKAQADFLRSIGRDIIVQGFLFARPMSEPDLLQFFLENE